MRARQIIEFRITCSIFTHDARKHAPLHGTETCVESTANNPAQPATSMVDSLTAAQPRIVVGSPLTYVSEVVLTIGVTAVMA